MRPHGSHGQAAIGGHLSVVVVGGRAEVFHRDLCDRTLALWSALALPVVHAFGPEIVIVGGLIVAGDYLFGPLAGYLRRYAWRPCGSVPLRCGECGWHAAVLADAVIAQGG